MSVPYNILRKPVEMKKIKHIYECKNDLIHKNLANA